MDILHCDSAASDVFIGARYSEKANGIEFSALREIMLPKSAFSIVSIAAMAAWLGLAVATPLPAGRARDTLLFFSGRVAPLLLCAAYVMFLAQYWGSTPGGGFRSLEAVQILFAAPGKMLGAWTHFLAFDLFVGRWLVDDASSRGNSRLPLLLDRVVTRL
jgi:hypothetical protein